MEKEIKTFSGSHFEIGQEMGAYYKACGVCFLPAMEATLLAKQLDFYNEFAPEVLEGFRGIAQGGGYDFDAVAQAHLVGEILFLRAQGQRSCSIGGFTDASGNVWVARNYDWHPAVAQVMQAWKFKLAARDVVAITDMGILDASGLDKSKQLFLYEDAINSDGLFIGVTFAYCWNEGVGLTSFDAVRLVSWRCKTVAEAVKFFENTKLASAKNFFISDADGDMAVVQHGVNSFDVRYPDKEGLLALTNHYVGPLEAEDQVRLSNPNHTTFPRYARLMRDMQTLKSLMKVEFADLDAMMTSPETPVSMCIKNPQASDQVDIETVWTLLMAPKQRRYSLINNPRSPSRASQDLVF